MGNLRQKYTDKEWAEMQERLEERDRNGVGVDNEYLQINLSRKSIDELRKLKKALSPFYSDWKLEKINDWIAWRKKGN